MLATATNQLELHYLEMLHIARARRDGAQLLNGDFGGPRPFNAIQLDGQVHCYLIVMIKCGSATFIWW